MRARPVTVVQPQDEDEEPELKLGREDEPEDRVTVAWIAHDDFEDLQARRSVTFQPAVQARLEPTPDAPLRSDASPDVAGPEQPGVVDVAVAAPPPAPTARRRRPHGRRRRLPRRRRRGGGKSPRCRGLRVTTGVRPGARWRSLRLRRRRSAISDPGRRVVGGPGGPEDPTDGRPAGHD